MCVIVLFYLFIIIISIFASIIGQPFVALPYFSNFAKISSPFFQRAMCSSIDSLEKLEKQEDEPPMMVGVVAQIQEEVLPLETGTCSLSFIFLFFFFSLSLSLFPFPYTSSCFMTLLIL